MASEATVGREWHDAATPVTRATERGVLATLHAFLVLARPRQWYKNLVVFVPIVFSNNAFAWSVWPHAFVTFGAFVLLSAATYALNDVLDAKRDRLHPVKRHRPVAAGLIPRLVAATWSLGLGAAGIAVLWWVNPTTMVMGGLFVVVQLAYNLVLKHTFLWDVLAIATGFVLRALAGTTAIAVGDPTVWLIVCTFLFAFYLGLAKRRSEVGLDDALRDRHRPVLAEYTVPFLDQTMQVATALLLSAYSLYTFFGVTPWMMLTLPFAYYGVFRYNHLRGQGAVRDEAELLLVDRPTLVNGAAWIFVVVLVLQGWPQSAFAWLGAIS